MYAVSRLASQKSIRLIAVHGTSTTRRAPRAPVTIGSGAMFPPEPENEQVTGFAVAIFGRYVADGVFFNEWGPGCCCGNHDGRQGNFEYVEVLR
ncbi:hypothetical protein PS858_01600 [Pseudomonas fluorescens]|nr:hypothetical protein PS858_01600 [Pseudomonas fluorescens]